MLTNIDDDKMPSVLQFTQDGFAVAGSLHTGVDESGSSTSVDVSLPSEPGYPVTVEITSSNTAEGKVWPASLVFDAANWETPQAVYVAGQDDNVRAALDAWRARQTAAVGERPVDDA